MWKTKDKGLTKLLEEIKKFQSAKIIVGILDDSTSEKHSNKDPKSAPLTILEIAIINHFGLRTDTQYIPPRPFLTNYTDNYTKEIDKIIYQGKVFLIKQKWPAERALGYIGEALVAGIRNQIVKDKPFVENSEVTTDIKGSSTPLVDSGQLVGSISYKIEF